MRTEIGAEQRPFETFFHHHSWSNDRIFDACLKLDQAQLDYASAGTYGSIKATLAHLVSAEEAYIRILVREEPIDDRRADPEMSLTELQTRVQHCDKRLLQIATSVEPGKMVEIYRKPDQADMIPAMVILLQTIHHGHEHRTQITSMLGQLGIEPPPLSFWTYYEE